MLIGLKQRTYEILEVAEDGDVTSRVVDISIMILIILNVAAVILETVKSIEVPMHNFFYVFELVSIIIFTTEYLLRLWACTVNPQLNHPVKGRLHYGLRAFSLIDLMAILPFYLPMFIPLDLRFIRAIRLLRLFRLFKLGRYSNAVKTFGEVLKEKKEELVITIFLGAVLLILSSSLMFYVETEQQPDKFTSIPESMWWGVTALTTVGYGDMYPVTPLGKILGSIIAFLGIGMFALPAGIFGSGFVEVLQKRRAKQKECPHCGKVF